MKDLPNITRANVREARETGCYGLLKGWAFSQSRRCDLHADVATNADRPFICRKCASPAVVRKCIEKVNHFAHQCPPSQAPISAREESALHKDCKKEIIASLKARFPEGNWEQERILKAVPEKGHTEVRPDLSGRLGVGKQAQPLVIEVQCSALSISKILKRILAYSRRNVPIFWVVPLPEPFKHRRFRPWLYERFLHSVYFGRVYYWWAGMGSKVLPVHFGLDYRHIPEAEFYDENGDFQEVGGYDVPLRIIKKPESAPYVDIASDFRNKHRREFTPHNIHKSVPPCIIWLDKHQTWWNAGKESNISPDYYNYSD